MRSRPISSRPRAGIIIGLLLCGAATVGVISRVTAELTKPGARERQVASRVIEVLANQHLSRGAIDDQVATRALKLFLSSFDPLKVYFTRADVDEFRTRERDLDDQVRKGNIDFAYTVYNRFLQRVGERMELIDQLLRQEHDFSVDESIVLDPELLDYPAAVEEIQERWRKRIKYDLLVLKGDKLEGQEARDTLRRRYQNFARRIGQFDADELLEAYLNAFTMSFDPHTTYMSPSQLENFRILMRLNLEGIGAQLQTNEYGHTVVAKIVPGGAAEKQGMLKAEDRIISVGQGDDGPMVDVVDMKLNDVVQLIRGKAGTVVRLGVKPGGEGEAQVCRIVRAQIELKDSEARGVIFEEGQKPSGAPFRVGVIDLPSFYMDMEGSRLNQADFKSTTRDVQKILEDFNRNGVDAVVLDLRKNGGGSLVEAISLTGLFIDEGPVVQVKDSRGTVEQYDDPDPGMTWAGPLVVATSKFSASASEILAGAVQDYRRGLVVGDKATHGKGTVQTLQEVGKRLFQIPNPRNEGAIKITVQQFYRPSGESTQQRGVLADVELPSLTTHMPIAEGDLEYALPFGKVASARFAAYDMLNPDIVRRLQELSQTRVAGSEDFRKAIDNIDRYTQQRQEKKLSLQAEKFFAERGEIDAAKEEEKRLAAEDSDSGTIKRDYYLNELLAITVDYLAAMGQNQVAQARPPVRNP